MAKVTVRPAQATDIPAVLAIERASFSDPWTENHLEEDPCLVATVDDVIAAFLMWRQNFPGDQDSLPEVEILNVAVHPEWRRRGLAKRLLKRLTRHSAIYFLEVRESNYAALALYRRLGFAEIARRKKYYRRPTETAIVMEMKRC